MARKLRIQYPGALYHIINRGNYRSDIFETAGAAEAFERTLSQACGQYEWLVHAWVLMRNHYHLALETPIPNLVAGMQWLQGTFAARFNRYRGKQGHLFQGRYKAILLEDSNAVFRVANYIYLNPVRAKIIPSSKVGKFRWSSLASLARRVRQPWLVGACVLRQIGLPDTDRGVKRYIEYLITLADDAAEQQRQGFDTMSSGWAIGTAGWRRAMARELARTALDPGLPADEAREINETRWQDVLDRALRESAKGAADITNDAKGARWKIEVAARLRRRAGAPYRWIAAALNMGSPLAVRVNVCRFANR